MKVSSGVSSEMIEERRSASESASREDNNQNIYMCIYGGNCFRLRMSNKHLKPRTEIDKV
jgi:hypothetical protein